MPSYNAQIQERLKLIRQEYQEREQLLEENGYESVAEKMYNNLLKEQYELEELEKKNK